jgi:ribonuclease E
MSQSILIDATHEQETIVVALTDGRIEVLDSQNDNKKSTNNNIYLAKVASIAPSLQAAFVDYGQGLHGFLPFSEIHPDYYQIPVEDRERLLEEMRNGNREKSRGEEDRAMEDDANAGSVGGSGEEVGEQEEEELVVSLNTSVSEGVDEKPYHKSEVYKRYKIQEVIKKDQVILVQVEKEERGHKGAALTTYISLAGRYCVFMPNATRGGGVSRKISDSADRTRLKKISQEVADEVGVNGALIIRTAGAFKTKTEIKRDCMYLQNLWNNIREHTVRSKAPTFIHEEGDVIKKTIRDLYNNEVKEILIQGPKAFEEAKAFMSALLPKNVHKLKLYEGKQALFTKYGVDAQIAQLYSNRVSLNSGGYLIITQTEALVTIDVNSGRSNSERNIESTAFKTNVEAAWEIAHQLVLRNLSGLIVIDFIDMEDKKNKRAVEKNLKDALAKDKARIQVGRISHFGLLEMSRQRVKQSFIESNTVICQHCHGRGRIRQSSASALAVLRAIEGEISTEGGEVKVFVCSDLASYLLNHTRRELAELDEKLKGKILIMVDENAGGDGFFIERVHKEVVQKHNRALSQIDGSAMDVQDFSEELETENVETEEMRKPKRKRKRNKKHVPSAGTREASDDIEDTPPAATEAIAKKRIKHGATVRHLDASNVAGAGDAVVDVVAETITPNHGASRRKWKKGKSSHTKTPAGQFSEADTAQRVSEASSQLEEDSFDDEMAERRKANQSLLREIWKKIVD